MQGTLVLDYRSFMVTDGLEYWRTLSPSLLFRLFYKKKKRDRVCGKWIVVGNWIVWFKKMKYWSEADINREKPRYSRKDIINEKTNHRTLESNVCE